MTCDLLDRGLLLDGLFGARLGLLLTTDQLGAVRDAGYLGDLIQFRDLIVGQVDELLAAGQARATVERRFLAGYPALFPDRQAGWVDQVAQSQRLGALAIGLTDKEGIPPPVPPEADISSARVERLIADLVEPARAEAIEDLGQGRRAFGIAASWVRGKLDTNNRIASRSCGRRTSVASLSEWPERVRATYTRSRRRFPLDRSKEARSYSPPRRKRTK